MFRELEVFSSRAAVPKVCCTSPQGIRGHISVMAALNFSYYVKEEYFVQSNWGTSLTDGQFVWKIRLR